MRSTFWPNRIFERQSSENRETGLKFSSKRENGALSMKIDKTPFSGFAEHVLAKLHLRASKFSRSSHWPQILFKTGKQCPFYENCTNKTLFSGHAQHVLAKSHLWASKFCNSSHWPEIVAKTGKQCAFYKNYTKRSFQVMGGKFWPNRIFERQSSENWKLASNSLQNGKTERLPWKLYKTLFSGHAQHVLAKSHFWKSNF